MMSYSVYETALGLYKIFCFFRLMVWKTLKVFCKHVTSSINFTKNIAVFQISSSLARPSAALISSSIISTEIPIFLTLRKIHITSIIPRDIREDIVWKSFLERKKFEVIVRNLFKLWKGPRWYISLMPKVYPYHRIYEKTPSYLSQGSTPFSVFHNISQ